MTSIPRTNRMRRRMSGARSALTRASSTGGYSADSVLVRLRAGFLGRLDRRFGHGLRADLGLGRLVVSFRLGLRPPPRPRLRLRPRFRLRPRLRSARFFCLCRFDGLDGRLLCLGRFDGLDDGFGLDGVESEGGHRPRGHLEDVPCRRPPRPSRERSG